MNSQKLYPTLYPSWCQKPETATTGDAMPRNTHNDSDGPGLRNHVLPARLFLSAVRSEMSFKYWAMLKLRPSCETRMPFAGFSRQPHMVAARTNCTDQLPTDPPPSLCLCNLQVGNVPAGKNAPRMTIPIQRSPLSPADFSQSLWSASPTAVMLRDKHTHTHLRIQTLAQISLSSAARHPSRVQAGIDVSTKH